jgi:hypothetical protein
MNQASLFGALSSADPSSIQRMMLQAGGIDGMKICLAPDLQVEFAQ